jgi:probable HAF family extracellular repeat protein
MTITIPARPLRRRAAAVALTASALAVGLATQGPAGAAELPLARGRGVPAGPLPIVDAVSNTGIVGGATASGVAALWYPDTARVRELGLLPGSYASTVYDIDDRGRAVGSAHGELGRYLSHAFRWTAGGSMVDLGSLGGIDASASASNNRGQVTGWSTLPGDATAHAFRWTSDGGMVDLGKLPGFEHSTGIDLNEDGIVVGSSSRIERDPAGMRQIFRGTVWVPGQAPIDIGGLGGDIVTPAAINRRGQVAGVATTADGTPHVFRWSRSTGMKSLGTVGPRIQVTGLTDSGTIVGVRQTSTDPSRPWTRPFLYTPACGFRDLPFASGPEGSAFATAVNDHGLVYGQVHDTFDEPYRIFAWDAATPPC